MLFKPFAERKIYLYVQTSITSIRYPCRFYERCLHKRMKYILVQCTQYTVHITHYVIISIRIISPDKFGSNDVKLERVTFRSSQEFVNF